MNVPPEDLRRRLELEAKRKGISLNQVILRRIA
jgi:predicted HicB family RNase H-like nuclease